VAAPIASKEAHLFKASCFPVHHLCPPLNAARSLEGPRQLPAPHARGQGILAHLGGWRQGACAASRTQSCKQAQPSEEAQWPQKKTTEHSVGLSTGARGRGKVSSRARSMTRWVHRSSVAMLALSPIFVPHYVWYHRSRSCSLRADTRREAEQGRRQGSPLPTVIGGRRAAEALEPAHQREGAMPRKGEAPNRRSQAYLVMLCTG
jgi:hypothetical protein